MSADTTRARALLFLAEGALVLLTVASVFGFARLFGDWDWIGATIAAGVLSHLLAIGTRRLGWGAAASLAASAVGFALVVSWLLIPDSTAYGVPTGQTWTRAGTELRDAWDLFREVEAPAPSARGLVLAAMFGAWLVGFVADTAAFRLNTSVEAAVPAATLFGFGAALGASRRRVPSTAFFLAAVLLFALTQRSLRQASTPTWLATDVPAGARPVLRRGAAIAGLTVVAAALLSPAIPGASAEALIPWRDGGGGDGPGSRVTISPLVDIRARLVDQSDRELFTVEASDRAYWRLTSLQTFDGRIWSSRGSYKPAAGSLPDDVAPGVPVRTIDQEFEIEALASIWLPAAFEPTSVEGGEAVRYDDDSDSLLTERETSDGLTYQITSALPVPPPEQLSAVGFGAPQEINDEYLNLPSDFSLNVREQARLVTGGSGTLYEKALALQSFFRTNFTYDVNVAAGHSANDIEEFVFETRRGYCEQFAGAYAAMARSLGIPARVAVGFTPGELQADDGLYHVRGRNAHAWPELWIDTIGWVAFEPTPGRGMPGAQTYTGVPEAQETQDQIPDATQAPASTVPADGTTATTQPDPIGNGFLESGDPGLQTPSDPGMPWPARLGIALLVVVVATVLWAAGLAIAYMVRRHRRHAAASTPRERVQLAWTEAGEALARSGTACLPWETPAEYAARAGRVLKREADTLAGLAEAATVAVFAPDEPDAALVADEPGEVDEVDVVGDEAAAAARSVERAVRERATFAQRVRWALDPRPLLPTMRARVVIERRETSPA